MLRANWANGRIRVVVKRALARTEAGQSGAADNLGSTGPALTAGGRDQCFQWG